jgi:glyoxylase-like metal-dependent hydrolase (beta-lactamase superfamily II)
MDIIQLMPRLYFIRLPVGHAYLWHDPGGLTLIDTGLPGSAPRIARGIRQAGYQPADLRRLVLTHHADAPFIHARAAGPPLDLAGWEQPLYDRVMSRLPPQPPVPPRIDRELGDGDEPGFGDVAVPGHTPGSIALWLPRHRVLFAGDAAARGPDGTVTCGVFNVSRTQAAASFRRLAGLSAELACFGHGEPLTRGATAALRAAALTLPADTGKYP